MLQAEMAGHGEQDQHEKHDDQSVHSSLNPFLKNLMTDLLFPF